MIKKIAILNGQVEHIYHSSDELNEFVIKGAEIEEREMEYSEEHGWREVGYVAEVTELEVLRDYVLEMEF